MDGDEGLIPYKGLEKDLKPNIVGKSIYLQG